MENVLGTDPTAMSARPVDLEGHLLAVDTGSPAGPGSVDVTWTQYAVT
jgi:hypothetical protein